MYILQQSDLDLFNAIKYTHAIELQSVNVDVIPIPNGVTEGLSFTPDGTFSIDQTYFAPGSESFYSDLVAKGFFNNLQQK